MAESSFVEKLQTLLEKQKDILQWRFYLVSSKQLQVGINQSQLCGPYAPPTFSNGLSAGVYVKWKNKTVSKVTLEPHHFDDMKNVLKLLKEQAFKDPHAASILKPLDYPKTKVFDPKAAKVLEDPSILFDYLSTYNDIFTKKKIPNVDAEATATVSETTIKSSTGIDVSYPSTSISTYAFAAGVYGEGDDSRKLLPTATVKRLANNVSKVIKSTQRNDKIPNTEIDVIFAPEVVDSMVETYLESNLMGSSIAENESAFSVDDFKKKKKICGSHVSFVLDSQSDFGSESVPCNLEGIPGGIHHMVKKGKLNTPELNVKYAEKLKMSPTGDGEKYLVVDGAKSFDDLVKKTKQGIIIYGVLGMHTQNSVTGDYSLPAHLVACVKNGKVVGGGKVSISGNFFKDMKSKDTVFAYDPKDKKRIGYKLRKKVAPLKG